MSEAHSGVCSPAWAAALVSSNTGRVSVQLVITLRGLRHTRVRSLASRLLLGYSKIIGPRAASKAALAPGSSSLVSKTIDMYELQSSGLPLQVQNSAKFPESSPLPYVTMACSLYLHASLLQLLPQRHRYRHATAATAPRQHCALPPPPPTSSCARRARRASPLPSPIRRRRRDTSGKTAVSLQCCRHSCAAATCCRSYDRFYFCCYDHHYCSPPPPPRRRHGHCAAACHRCLPLLLSVAVIAVAFLSSPLFHFLFYDSIYDK